MTEHNKPLVGVIMAVMSLTGAATTDAAVDEAYKAALDAYARL